MLGSFTRTCAACNLVLVSCLVLASCGFHLQGHSPLPQDLQFVYVDYQSPRSVEVPPLLNDVKDVLRSRGAKLTKNAETARAVLTLSPPESKRQFNSVSSNGRDRSYTLIESVSYELRVKSSGQKVKRHLQVTQDYSFNGNVAVASQDEADRLRKSMQRELAQQMYFQLQAAVTHPSAAASGRKAKKYN